MLYLLLLITCAFAAYTAFQVFAIRESIEELRERLEFAIAPKRHEHPPNARDKMPDELRLRGL